MDTAPKKDDQESSQAPAPETPPEQTHDAVPAPSGEDAASTQPASTPNSPAISEGHAVVPPATEQPASTETPSKEPQAPTAPAPSGEESASTPPASQSENAPSSSPSDQQTVSEASENSESPEPSTSSSETPPDQAPQEPPRTDFMATQPESSSGGMRKWLIIILVAILLGGIGGGIYYFLGHKKQPVKEVTKVTEPQSPSPTPDPYSTWKTYENKEVGYTLKYPKNWDIDTSDSALDFQLISDSKEVITATEKTNSDKLSVTDWMSQTYPQADLSVYKTATLSGQEVRVSTQRQAAYLHLPNDHILVLLYRACAQATCTAGKDPKVLSDIVNTFTVTAKNTAIDTKNWKTYTQTTNGFTMQYPPTWKLTESKDNGKVVGAKAEGKEGTVTALWGSGFGGGCDQNEKVTVTAFGKDQSVCHAVDKNGTETWRGIGIAIDSSTSIDVTASASVIPSNSKDVVLAILNSLSVSK